MLRRRRGAGARHVSAPPPLSQRSFGSVDTERESLKKLSVCLSVCLSIYLLINAPTYLFIYLSIYLSTCLSLSLIPVKAIHLSEAAEVAARIPEAGAKALARALKAGAHSEDRFHEWCADLHDIELTTYNIPVTVKSLDPAKKTEQRALATVPFYEYIAAAYEFGAATFRRIFLGKEPFGFFEEYWLNAQRNTWGREHPALQGATDLAFVIPLQHHSDGAVFQNKIEFQIYSVSSVAGVGSSYDTKMVVAIIDAAVFVDGGETDRQITDYLSWCNDVARRGVWPHKGYFGEELTGYRLRKAGQPLAGPWRSAFAAWKGDWAARVKIHRFYGRNAQSDLVCEHCMAHKKIPMFHYTNCRPEAAWRLHRTTHSTYMRRPPHEWSPWCRHAGWRLERNLQDWLHVLHIHGVCCDLCASAMKYLSRLGAWGPPDLDQNMKQCRYDCVAWLKSHNVRGVSFPRFDSRTIGLGTSKNAMPLLTGQIKGAHVKPLAFYLNHVASHFLEGSNDPLAALVQTCLYSFSMMAWHCDRYPLLLTAAQAEDIASFGDTFQLAYSELAALDRSSWNMRPKFHSLSEILISTRLFRENPAKQSTIMEEDLMGRCKKIGVKVHRTKVEVHAMARYLILQKTRWKTKHDGGPIRDMPVKRARRFMKQRRR